MTSRRGLVAILCLGVLAGCGSSGPTPAASGVSSGLATASPGVPASPLDSSEPHALIEVDPSLLSILPSEVGGVPLEPAPEAATEISMEPTLSADVEAIAVALAFATSGSSPSASEDLVIANVVRLRPDVFSDEFFRGWRDTYDAAACETAGGLRGNAQAEIDGRQVFIGSCANGGFTYHLRYGEDVIISLTSVGERRLGEQLVKNLGD